MSPYKRVVPSSRKATRCPSNATLLNANDAQNRSASFSRRSDWLPSRSLEPTASGVSKAPMNVYTTLAFCILRQRRFWYQCGSNGATEHLLFRNQLVLMKITIASAVYHTATSNVTQALVNVWKTPAIVNAHEATQCVCARQTREHRIWAVENVYTSTEMVRPVSMGLGHWEPLPRNPAFPSHFTKSVPACHRPA